jgi:hypothetical protein
MGKRPTNATKGGKFMNPTDQARYRNYYFYFLLVIIRDLDLDPYCTYAYSMICLIRIRNFNRINGQTVKEKCTF